MLASGSFPSKKDKKTAGTTGSLSVLRIASMHLTKRYI